MLILGSFSISAAPENKSESLEKENKRLQKDLRIDLKKEENIKPSSQGNRLSNPEILTKTLSKPESKMYKSEFGSQKSCQNSLNMMEKRLKVLESNLSKRRELIQKITTNLRAKIDTLNASGLDTTGVETTLETYIEETNKLISQREGLIMVLADLTRFDCDSDPSNFRNNIKDFNQRFKNQNLEFNKLNAEFKSKVLQEIDKLISSVITPISSEESNE